MQLLALLDKHKELEDAYVVQTKLIQKMQKKVGKLDKYVETIETQEKVILRMQSIIECSSTNKAKQNSEAGKNDAKLTLSTATGVSSSTERVNEDNSKLDEFRATIAEKDVTIASINQRMADLQLSCTSLQEVNVQLQRESEINNGKDAEIRRLTEVVSSYKDRASPPTIPENDHKIDELSLQQEVGKILIFFPHYIFYHHHRLLFTHYIFFIFYAIVSILLPFTVFFSYLYFLL